MISSLCYQLVIGLFCSVIPMPRIFKGENLSFTVLAALILKQHIIAAIRVERWIKVDKINTVCGKILSQNLEVITIKKRILHDRLDVHPLQFPSKFLLAFSQERWNIDDIPMRS